MTRIPSIHTGHANKHLCNSWAKTDRLLKADTAKSPSASCETKMQKMEDSNQNENRMQDWQNKQLHS